MRKKNKNKILVHGWLSATLDLLFHACLLALSPSGRHGRTTAAVIIMVLLLYCGWLLCCCYCCPCARRNWRNIYVEKTRTRVVQNRVFAKKRFTWSLLWQKKVQYKTKYKSHARSPAIGQPHIVPFSGLKRLGTPGFVYLSIFQLILASFEPIRCHTLLIVPRHVSYEVSSYFARNVGCCLLKWYG